MTRGRKPKTEEEQRLSGNAGHRAAKEQKQRASDAVPVLAADEPPADLPEFAKQKWREYIPCLREMGQLKTTDMEALRQLCKQLWIEYDASCKIEEYGSVIKTASKHVEMMRENPAVGIQARAARNIKMYLEALGMTTLGRRRLIASGAQLGLPLDNQPPHPNSNTTPTATDQGHDADDPTGFISRAIN